MPPRSALVKGRVVEVPLAGAKVISRSSGSPVALATAFGLTGAERLIVPKPLRDCR